VATRTWSAAADANWSAVSSWDGGASVPATTDAIVFDATSIKNCTIDNLGTWSGGTFTIAATYSGIISQNTGINITTAAYSQAAGTFTAHAAATFTSTTYSVSAGVFTQGGVFTCTTFGVTGSGTFTGGSAGMTTGALTFSNTASLTATSGTWSCSGSMTLANTPTFNAHGGTIALVASTTVTINMSGVTFNLVTINITGIGSGLTISSGTTIPLGASPTTVTGTTVGGTLTVTGTVTATGTWNHSGSLTVSPTTGVISSVSTIILTTPLGAVTWTYNATGTIPSGLNLTFSVGAASTNGIFVSAAATYGTLRLVPTADAASVSLGGSGCTFNEMRCNDGVFTATLTVVAGTTHTINTITIGGVAGKLVTINSSSAGTPFTWTTPSGNKTVNFCSIKDSTVDASPTWRALDSTNVSGNTNWVFGAPAGASGHQLGHQGGHQAPAIDDYQEIVD